MNFTSLKWNDWEAIKCSTVDFELIVGVSAGPRILSVKYRGGENLLYRDTLDFKVGEWRIYGGHRFTLAPETDESYYPDNQPCETKIINSKLIVKAPVRSNGIQLSMIIEATVESTGFEIHHILENTGEKDWTGALWAITCVPRSIKVFTFCPFLDVHFWQGTDPSNWRIVENQIVIKSGNFRGKIGWHCEDVWISAVQAGGTLSIHSPDVSLPSECVDFGSNIEIFACSDFIELETLSKRLIVLPGGFSQHKQRWELYS